ncbi:MAG: hypothetical protein ABJA98_12330 [Acidobacteriota bacterium]
MILALTEFFTCNSRAALLTLKRDAADADDTRPRRAAVSVLGATLSILCSVSATFAAERVSHVHIGDRGLKAVMDRGLAGSETFRSIVARLDASPIQVFANCDLLLPEGLSGRLKFVSNVGGVRYVQVSIRCSISTLRQLSFLAHELQHALEIGDNSEIADADSMESYYAEVGFEIHVDNHHRRSFETDAAIDAQRRVEREMKDRPSRDEEAETGQRAPSQ